MCTYGVTHLNGNDVPVMCKTSFFIASVLFLCIYCSKSARRVSLTHDWLLLWSSCGPKITTVLRSNGEWGSTLAQWFSRKTVCVFPNPEPSAAPNQQPPSSSNLQRLPDASDTAPGLPGGWDFLAVSFPLWAGARVVGRRTPRVCLGQFGDFSRREENTQDHSTPTAETSSKLLWAHAYAEYHKAMPKIQMSSHMWY